MTVQNKCGICQKEARIATAPNCDSSHLFCAACILGSLEHSPRCPVCNVKITRLDLVLPVDDEHEAIVNEVSALFKSLRRLSNQGFSLAKYGEVQHHSGVDAAQAESMCYLLGEYDTALWLRRGAAAEIAVAIKSWGLGVATVTALALLYERSPFALQSAVVGMLALRLVQASYRRSRSMTAYLNFLLCVLSTVLFVVDDLLCSFDIGPRSRVAAMQLAFGLRIVWIYVSLGLEIKTLALNRPPN